MTNRCWYVELVDRRLLSTKSNPRRGGIGPIRCDKKSNSSGYCPKHERVMKNEKLSFDR